MARSENVGMSNIMQVRTLHPEKPKVSHAMLISVGLVGPKMRLKGVVDGQQVNIPAPYVVRPGHPGANPFLKFSSEKAKSGGVNGMSRQGGTALAKASGLMDCRREGKALILIGKSVRRVELGAS